MPTILAVDDSATMRKALEITFARTEFDVVTCDSAAAALEKVKTEQPTLVIADVSLPPSDGYELCTTIKLASPGLPVLMLSSRHNPFDEGRGAQADAHIDKPFDTQVLADKVREMVAAAGEAKPAAAAAAPARPAARPPVAAAAAPARPQPPAARPAAKPAAVGLKETMPLGAGPRTGGAAAARPAAARDAKAPAPKPAAGTSPGVRPSAPGKPVGRPSAPTIKGTPNLKKTQAWGKTPEPEVAETTPRPAAGTLPGMAVGAQQPAPAKAQPRGGAIKRATVSSWPAPPPTGEDAPDPQVPAQAPLGQDVVAAATGDLGGKLAGLGLTADQVQGVLALSREVLEQVVWEVVPTLAETLIKEEIARLTQE